MTRMRLIRKLQRWSGSIGFCTTYPQTFPACRRALCQQSSHRVRVRADLFNIFDNQTGYNIQNKRNSANFGDPRDFFNPRRLQLMVKFEF